MKITENGIERAATSEEEVEILALQANAGTAIAPLLPISDRQFFQQLALDGEITEEEAIAAVATGTIPTALQAVIDTLPPADQFAARMFLQGATIFERNHPMTLTLGALMAWSPEQMDALWTNAAGL